MMHKEVPIHTQVFGEVYDYGTLKQFKDVYRQPNVLAAALMPDAHVGYTMPIGGVALVKNAVYPSWVGYDIGCGVCAVKVANSSFDRAYVMKHKESIRNMILHAVPTKDHKHSRDTLPDTKRLSKAARLLLVTRNAYNQLGTLGGGNHFIEVGYDEDGGIWVVIHSGSRGVGHGIAGHWMNEAKGPCDMGGMDFFNRGTKNYDAYMTDQLWCIDYALKNRKVMLELISTALHINFDWDTLINKVHNTALHTEKGILHRKGATDASLDELGVIPGNMRDGSVIVRGLGNDWSLSSCSHGAGRTMGRGKAHRTLSLETFQETMKEAGVACDTAKGCLDEAPDAYKNFQEVMYAQRELCTIVHTIKPIVNVKG